MRILAFSSTRLSNLHLVEHEDVPDVVELYRYGRYLFLGFCIEHNPGVVGHACKNEVEDTHDPAPRSSLWQELSDLSVARLYAPPSLVELEHALR